MPRHIKLRNNINKSFATKIYNFRYFFLSIKTSVRFIGLQILAEPVADTDTSETRKLRIAFQLYSESLVIGKMPVKTVEFQRRRNVYHFFKLINRKHVSRTVNHKSAVLKSRRIVYRADGNQVAVKRNDLLKRFFRIEKALFR